MNRNLVLLARVCITLVLMAPLSGCFVQGEEAPAWVVLNLEAEDSPEASASKRLRETDSWQASESLCLVVQVTANDLEEPLVAESHLAAGSATPDYLDIELEVAPGNDRAFTATVFTEQDGSLVSYQNTEPLLVDLAEGASVHEDLRVQALQTATADLRLLSNEEGLTALMKDTATGCVLGLVPCEATEMDGERSCLFPNLPLNRELLPGVQTPDGSTTWLTDKPFMLAQSGEARVGPLALP